MTPEPTIPDGAKRVAEVSRNLGCGHSWKVRKSVWNGKELKLVVEITLGSEGSAKREAREWLAGQAP